MRSHSGACHLCSPQAWPVIPSEVISSKDLNYLRESRIEAGNADERRRVSGGWSALDIKTKMALIPIQPNFYYPPPAQMANSRSISLNCPVLHCTTKFKTERAKDCLRVHLQNSKDKDHKDIYIARYSEHQKSATIYTCPTCRRTFEKKSRLKRHNESVRKYSPESRLRVINILGHWDRYSKSRCPKCYKALKYPLSEHLNRERCKAQSGPTKSLATSKLPSWEWLTI